MILTLTVPGPDTWLEEPFLTMYRWGDKLQTLKWKYHKECKEPWPEPQETGLSSQLSPPSFAGKQPLMVLVVSSRNWPSVSSAGWALPLVLSVAKSGFGLLFLVLNTDRKCFGAHGVAFFTQCFLPQGFPPCHQSVRWGAHAVLYGPGKLWTSGKHAIHLGVLWLISQSKRTSLFWKTS